jgi:hypothetical protein
MPKSTRKQWTERVNGKKVRITLEKEEQKPVKKDDGYKLIKEVTKDIDGRKVKLIFEEEKPRIESVRTRYDPQVMAYGDAGAVMPVRIGYPANLLKSSWRNMLFLNVFYFTGIWVFGYNIVDFAGKTSFVNINGIDWMILLFSAFMLPACCVMVVTELGNVFALERIKKQIEAQEATKQC